MVKDFVIDSSIALKGNGFYFDLHNCYDYQGIRVETKEYSKLEVIFTKTKGDWVKSEDPEILVLVFREIKYFETSPGFFLNRCETIEEIGYKDVGDNNYDWLLMEEQANSSSSLLFRFENEEYFRAYSLKVEIITL